MVFLFLWAIQMIFLRWFTVSIVLGMVGLLVTAGPTRQINSVKPIQDNPIANINPKVNNVVPQAGPQLRSARNTISEKQYSPYEIMTLAYSDIVAVASLHDPNLDPEYIRYLSLHNFSRIKRQSLKSLIDFTLNSLNPGHRDIIRTAPIPANSSAPILVRVNLKDYGILPKAWDELSEKGSGPVPIPDPYFHVQVILQEQELPQTITTFEYSLKLTHSIINTGHNKKGRVRIQIPANTVLHVENKKLEISKRIETFLTTPLAKGQAHMFQFKAQTVIEGKTIKLEQAVPIWVGKTTRVKIELVKEKINVETKLPPKVKKKARKEIQVTAPWLALESNPDKRGTTVAALIELSHSKNPILRADWFIIYSTWAPEYYSLIGLKRKPNPKDKKKLVFLEKDFEKLFKFKIKDAKEDIVAAITDTKIVALHNRLIHRFSTVRGVSGGYYWRSEDTDSGIDKEDYLNQIAVFDKPKIKAQEIIASGRNGMNFYALTDANGIVLDVAVANIAIHGDLMPTRFQDKQVYSARNCMLCHAGGQIILRDKVRNLSKGKLALFITDKTTNRNLSRKIIEAFNPNTKSLIDLDNAKYIASVRASCNKGKEIGKDLEALIDDYYYKPVTLEDMAWEAGIDKVKLLAILKRGINLDHTLNSILQDPPEDVSRLPWERQGFTALMVYIINNRDKP